MAEMEAHFSEVRDRVSEYSGVARKKVTELADSRKSTLVQTLDRFAQSLEEAGKGDGGPERQLLTKAADYVRRAKDNVDNRSSDEILNMAVKELRRRPGAIVAGLFAIGFFGARLLRT